MTQMASTLELTGMRFYAFHGCLPSERLIGTEYLVDFRCNLDTAAAEASDDIADALDYSRVYDVAARQMAIPSNLIEHVAGRIADALQEEFLSLEHFELTVSKKNPPVGGECQWARITIRR